MLVLLAAAGCSSTRFRTETGVSERFAALRPPIVAVRAEPGAEDLGAAVYDGLIARDYSVLAPGVAPGPEAGVVRVRVAAPEESPGCGITFEDAAGTLLYQCRILGEVDDPALAAAALLGALPRK